MTPAIAQFKHCGLLVPPNGERFDELLDAVTANGFAFIAGQLPIASDGAKLAEAPFEQQAQEVLYNVALALAGAGSAIDRLVQVRVYVTDIKLWPLFDAIYAQWIGSSCPARAVVPVPELHYGLKIEIEAVALEG